MHKMIFFLPLMLGTVPLVAVVVPSFGSRQVEMTEAADWADEFADEGRPDPAKWTYERGFVRNFPIGPYANFFLEHDGLEPRMLMGAQTVLYSPQDFLFYSLAIWNSDRCIEVPGTFTDWNPRGYANCNGEGSWCCVGPDGRGS